MPDSKLILITGATRGLGRAMTLRFAAEGHRVLGCGRSEQNVEHLRDSLGPAHDFDVVDVSDDKHVGAWAARLLSAYGPPDFLLNNAALMNAPAKLWEIPAEEFDKLIDVNIKGVSNIIRHFVPAMVARGSGVIVNFSSGWGRSTSPEVGPYCASKWAIEGLTRSLAQELPAGVAAVPLNPGTIDTDMLRTCWADGASQYPDPTTWAESAVPFLLALGSKDNGRPLVVPGR
jgi:NAD(P)-dependent dehydrogenase (short-subunit alcohol dehydrogenase family)